jgi:CubicO group peptidase (beta-lactamase class C family)
MHTILRTLLLLTICARAQAQSDIPAALDALFSREFRADEPGAAVLVVQNDEVIFSKGYGISDIRTREPITTRTLFNIGSISKTFVAYGILKLVDEKKLSLDDPIGKFFPDFKNKDIAQQVRIKHLLTHSSGLPDNRRVKEDSVYFLTAKDAENWAPIMQNDTLHFAPGTRFEYSNPAFNALALIIEQVTKRKWQDYIRELIFQPAGMKHSLITDGPFPEKGVSHAYVRSGNGWSELDYGEEPTFAAAGNGGVWSNVEELWKYEQAIHSAKFLSPAWIGMSRVAYPQPGWKDKTPPFIGLSWFTTFYNGIPMMGHTGSQGGFVADYVWVPGQSFFYVVLCNQPRDVAELRAKVFAACGIKDKSRG